MILTTMCYLKRQHQTLMLHRTKKANDINSGKWIGVGGKFEAGESAEECMKREIYEETGFIAHDLKLHGFVMFPQLYHGEDEGMFVYTCDDFSGQMHECDEGVLQWIDDEAIASLPMWEGDYHFFDWIKDGRFHSAKIFYQDDHVVEYQDCAY
ncbi:NUDIX hydrolase [Candidatus Stoquefichus sp. SB1]|uniref:NUDIX hydrolase n=1 Tax=Candidatus Stoquefichus sp. SB1 TaxID=1658109 RepID=UPI00067F6F37|nr:8-oxo-dGTP diphosphatase [Candidatus Stoquefichus sp. SB1]